MLHLLRKEFPLVQAEEIKIFRRNTEEKIAKAQRLVSCCVVTHCVVMEGSAHTSNVVMTYSYPNQNMPFYDHSIKVETSLPNGPPEEVAPYLQRISHLEDQLQQANNRIQMLQTQILKKGNEAKQNKVKR